mgnify:CR=1 FL=1
MGQIRFAHKKPFSHIILKCKKVNEKRISPINTDIFLWMICLVTSTSLLFIASRSSPLYPFNDWADVNTFFTMGKGMLSGKVLYRDLFDHKGPFLYFVYGIASLISYKTFLGVYILETFSLTIFLFLSAKTLMLFLDRKYTLLALPVLAAAILNLRSFAYGGTAEAFTFPFMMASLYFLTYYFKEIYPNRLPLRWGFLLGIFAGCILWTKYSFLGFWLGWILIVCISALVHNQFLHIFKFIALFCAGMLVATFPWILYFGIHLAIRDWINAYFVVNLTAYAKNLSLGEILQIAIDSYQRHLQFNPLAVGLLSLGILLFTTLRQFIRSWWYGLGLILSIGLLAFSVYGGGRDYIYYFLIFAPFLIFGFVELAYNYQAHIGTIPSNLLVFILLIVSLLLSFGYTFRFNRNTDFRHTDKQDMAQIQFAEIIKLDEDARLLNYGFQDSGFYTATGIVPDGKYFQKYNFEYGTFPINMDEQNRYIREKRVDYVVIRSAAGESTTNLDLNILNENYHLIAQKSQPFGEQFYNYELFQRK